MLYYDINYYHNRFFIVNNKYYIYVYVSQNKYIYDFKIINDELIVYIQNKNRKIKDNFKFKIMYEDLECMIHFTFKKGNQYNIGKISDLIFEKSLYINDINISNHYLEDNIKILFPNFDINYYISNNKFINDNNKNNEKFIIYNWYFSGQYNPQMYFKYLLKKYEYIINNFKLNISNYSEQKNNTLLFVDDRYDSLFLYLLKLFLYSVDESWNVTIFTIEENRILYEEDLLKLNIIGKINILKNKFSSNHDYSNLLKTPSFWKEINEENVLLFQYDSFCSGKFNNDFLNYNYLGARWPHNPLNNSNISIGNGGTSFRKTRIMEMISKKYHHPNYSEDIFFSNYLYIEKLYNCNNEIADNFAFENIYCENSIYSHQIYNTIKLSDLDNFIYEKLKKM